jgi:hypothetical protein
MNVNTTFVKARSVVLRNNLRETKIPISAARTIDGPVEGGRPESLSKRGRQPELCLR